VNPKLSRPELNAASGAALTLAVDLPNEAATAALAEDVAASLRPGDLVTLSGPLGAGKTTFARALIRAIADDPSLEVPSPTFTLVQSYAGGRLKLAHFDLYRIADAAELDELGFDEALGESAVLMEWPERVSDRLPPERLDLSLAAALDGRRATLVATGAVAERLARSHAIRSFLDRSAWQGAARRHLVGDGSNRRYERVHRGGATAVLMDWPPGEPPMRDPRAAHRARDVRAFVAVDTALGALGLSAPAIYAGDAPAGLLLLEDFGRAGVLRSDGSPDPARYTAAVDVLVYLHSVRRPSELPLPDGSTHALPPYGPAAFAVEVELFADWYVPRVSGKPLPTDARAEFVELWQELTGELARVEENWVLLDYHSPNLLWLADRTGLRRVGILDFQDLLVGPSAYDVASLCQDARVTIPPDLEQALCSRYIAGRSAGGRFDRESFEIAYAILTAQRTTKIMGVFTRLATEGKAFYLQHIPRLREYLQRSLAHPALNRYALWHEKHLPH
jgi:tRNA threonylcarbamoyl adenosine modification protein YjeE